MNIKNTLIEKEVTMYHKGKGVETVLEDEIDTNWYHTYYINKSGKVLVKEFMDEIYDNRVFEADTLEEAFEEAQEWKKYI